MRHLIFLVLLISSYNLYSQPSSNHDLYFNQLATQWDEAIPLDNAILGALVRQKEGELRFSLDRSDLWDLRLAGVRLGVK